MDNVMNELQEYIVVTGPSQLLPNTEVVQSTPSTSIAQSPIEYKWAKNETKILIDLYAKYKKKTGTFEVKTVKMMWQKIAEEFQALNINVTASNCMNRWKVLERNYKKFIDNQTKTGRGRKYFEFEEEMNQIFGKKRNVHPELLLATDTVEDTVDNSILQQIPTNSKDEIPMESDVERENTREISQGSPEPAVKTAAPLKKKSLIVKKKISVMEKIRTDRKTYYDARLEIEKKKLEQQVLRNQLIKERNEILKTKNCVCNTTL